MAGSIPVHLRVSDVAVRSGSEGSGVADQDPRRRVPRTDLLLADQQVGEAVDRLGPDTVKQVIHAVQEQIRSGLLSPESAVSAVLELMPGRPSSLTPVINATGVVLHTNLGRASLSGAAAEALEAASGYVDVEFDLASGTRAPRGAGVLAALLDRAAAAEAALVVNNGAAALALACAALASGRDLLVSRGELIEIGDGFRLPALIESTGARIREVGTTNRTTLTDYREAVDDRCAAILKVHPSNFRIEGFTSGVGTAELADLGLPVVVDIGSGLLEPDPLLPDEPDAQSALRAGASLVTCSADKLLGGPQAGLILGAAQPVATLRRHPLARAFRVDKLTLAALEATVSGPRTPTWQYLHLDPVVLRQRADAIAERIDGGTATVVPSDGAVGGGGAPGVRLPGWAVALPESYLGRLRAGRPPIVGRIERGQCLLDLRCVPPEQDDMVTAAINAAAADTPSSRREPR